MILSEGAGLDEMRRALREKYEALTKCGHVSGYGHWREAKAEIITTILGFCYGPPRAVDGARRRTAKEG